MTNSSEFVSKVKNLSRKIEEVSAQGFRTKADMEVLYALESAMDALMASATAEYLAATRNTDKH
jgi:hypothetical protein